MDKELMKDVETILFERDKDITQENANLNGKTSSAKQNLVAGTVLKEYATDELLSPKSRAAFKSGLIHIHDHDHYALGTTTCTQIDLAKVLKGGWVTNGAPLREPQTITTAMAHAAIIMQANQNQQHGGQSFPNWDFDLAPYVTRSYNKHLTRALELHVSDYEKFAMDETRAEVERACEAFVHNMNTMNGSRGGQSVFSSINFGLDTSWEGRMIIDCTMRAQVDGLGEGVTPIYPILIFKVKSGVNFNEGDPNYDLYRMANFCTAKTLFPNYQFCDSTFNKQPEGTDPRKEIATMGCRTRVFENIHGESTPVGRGNASFTTINLPMVAAASKSAESFYNNLFVVMDTAMNQLLDRFNYQKSKTMSQFDFVYGQGGFELGDHEFDPNKELGDVLDIDALSIGFIGLYECVYILKEKHGIKEATYEEMDRLMYKIAKNMSKRCKEYGEAYGLNVGLLATPSEGLAGKSKRIFDAIYEPINDNDFFTNSYHVPVWIDMPAEDKIKYEGKYHELCPSGHISYIEMDGTTAKDSKNIDKYVRLAAEANMGYFSVNVPIDRCTNCGNKEPIQLTCPKCGSANIGRTRRITGYLVGEMDRWNSGKADEESKRVKHTNKESV